MTDDLPFTAPQHDLHEAGYHEPWPDVTDDQAVSDEPVYEPGHHEVDWNRLDRLRNTRAIEPDTPVTEDQAVPLPPEAVPCTCSPADPDRHLSYCQRELVDPETVAVLRAQGAATERERALTVIRETAAEYRDKAIAARTASDAAHKRIVATVLDGVADLLDGTP